MSSGNLSSVLMFWNYRVSFTKPSEKCFVLQNDEFFGNFCLSCVLFQAESVPGCVQELMV